MMSTLISGPMARPEPRPRVVATPPLATFDAEAPAMSTLIAAPMPRPDRRPRVAPAPPLTTHDAEAPR